MASAGAWAPRCQPATLLRAVLCTLWLLQPVLSRQLRRIVLVGRHSVKNPYPEVGTSTWAGGGSKPLTAYTGQQLPPFPVGPGQLTPQGRKLMGHLGTYYHEHYADFLRGVPCERFAIYADPESARDMDSADAFAKPILEPKGCKVAVNHGAMHSHLKRVFRDMPDAWDAEWGCRPPSPEDLGVLLGFKGGISSASMPSSWLRVYRRQLNLVQYKTNCCTEDACAEIPGAIPDKCTLSDLPLVLNPNITWRAVGGPFGVASAFAEIFQMQFCEGLDAGWGLSEEDVVELMSLLDVPLNEAGTNGVTARNLGSDLMDALLHALAPPEPTADAAPAVVAYFGHDTNLHFLRRMLGLQWLSDGWWPNLVEPGAQLVFEVYDEGIGGKQTVRLLKVVATPKQQRMALPLDKSTPPSIVPVWIPGCDGVFCPLPDFLRIARAAMRPQCVRSPTYNETAPDRPGAAAAAPRVAATAPLPRETPAVVEAEPWAAPQTPARPMSAPPPPQPTEALVPALPLPPTQPPPSQGGWGSGYMFVLLLAAVGFFTWRYLQKKRAARGYEILGSKPGGRFQSSDRILGNGVPGFTL